MMYWRWERALPKEICEMLMTEVKNEQLVNSAVGGRDFNEINSEIRNSKNFWLKPNHWFEGILFNHIRYANSSMELNCVIEKCEQVQYTQYETGQKYDWHLDQSNLDYPCRKLTAVCQINDTSEFTGGGLIAKFDGRLESDNLLKYQGDIVVFPSYVAHKALTVESGKRITAVLWATGPLWK